MPRFTRLDTLVTTLRTGLMPVFFSEDPAVAVRLLRALSSGGVRTVEFVNRGDGAADLFAELEHRCRRELADTILGIGSVLDAGTAAQYLNLGASFVVSPSFIEEIAIVCNRRKVAYMPAAATPAEVRRAEEFGCEVIKVFPAQTVGPSFVSDLLAPCPWTRLMPTGDLAPDRESLSPWLAAGAAGVGLGKSLVPDVDIAAENWDAISARSRAALDLIAECRRPITEVWAA
jgi:2-dehydro-3-deoxyphosphogluconate aldolase/(4S)-4-hydroxy-2-oxoglutarate aldolase